MYYSKEVIKKYELEQIESFDDFKEMMLEIKRIMELNDNEIPIQGIKTKLNGWTTMVYGRHNHENGVVKIIDFLEGCFSKRTDKFLDGKYLEEPMFSRSEIRRLINDGAVRLDWYKPCEKEESISDESIIKALDECLKKTEELDKKIKDAKYLIAEWEELEELTVKDLNMELEIGKYQNISRMGKKIRNKDFCTNFLDDYQNYIRECHEEVPYVGNIRATTNHYEYLRAERRAWADAIINNKKYDWIPEKLYILRKKLTYA
jgi:hypothetical protein